MAQKLRVTLIRSEAGRPRNQRTVLRGLGLRKLNSTVVLEDTPAIRGMVTKVSHLVSCSPVDGDND